MVESLTNTSSFLLGAVSGSLCSSVLLYIWFRRILKAKHHTKYISGCDTSKRKDTYRFLNDCKMTIVVRSDLGMGKGKIASQCCHAAVACTRRASRICPDALRSWERSGQPKIILKCLTEQELLQLERDAIVAKIPCYLVFDAGRTQIASGTPTALGVGPASSSLIDQITGKLKLL